MTEKEAEEYRSLRATIGQRGSVRTGAFVAGLGAWAICAVGATLVMVPAVTLFPLVLLAGTFEAVFSLHVGAERIGRYLQLFHRDKWEETAMAFGAPLSGTGADPLFVIAFGLATLCNLVPLLLVDAVRIELAVIGGAHALVLVRLAIARRAAARQRAADLVRFEQLRPRD
jgi:hypothetical protein